MTSFTLFADDQMLLDLIKKTSSIYSGVVSIDDDNSSEIQIETTLTGQKVFMQLSSRKLETTAYTLINNDPANSTKKIIARPSVYLGNVQVLINNISEPTLTCNGSDVLSADTSCVGRKCTVVQRIISKCNEENCYLPEGGQNPAEDKTLLSSNLGALRLNSKIDISDCLTNNVEGSKYVIKFTTQGTGAAAKSGGTIQYSIILQNDKVSSKARL